MLDLDEFLRSYERATNSHDFDQVQPLISSGAVYWFSNGTHVGLLAIRQAFESTWAAIADEDYRISDLHWLAVSDEVASCVYTYSWSGMIGGQRRSGTGRGTNVLTGSGSGWQIIHEHLSSPSSQPPSPYGHVRLNAIGLITTVTYARRWQAPDHLPREEPGAVFAVIMELPTTHDSEQGPHPLS